MFLVVLASDMVQTVLGKVEVTTSIVFPDAVGAARELLGTFDAFSSAVWTAIPRVLMSTPCLPLRLDEARRPRH